LEKIQILIFEMVWHHFQILQFYQDKILPITVQFFSLLTTISAYVPKISVGNILQDKETAPVSLKKVDLFQISQDTTPSKRPTRTPRNQYMKNNRIVNLFPISMLLINKSLRSTETAADQLNKRAKLIFEQQHQHKTDYPLLDFCEEKATILINANAVKITNNNELTDKTTILIPISHHHNCPASKSVPGSEFHHNCPTATVPTAQTNSYNRMPDLTKPIQLHSLKKKSTSLATAKPSLILPTTGISPLSTMDAKEAPTDLTSSNFQQSYERQTTINNSLLKQLYLTRRLHALYQHASLTVSQSSPLLSSKILRYLLIFICISIIAIYKLFNQSNQNTMTYNNNKRSHNNRTRTKPTPIRQTIPNTTINQPKTQLSQPDRKQQYYQ
jgi:hypothetical protein